MFCHIIWCLKVSIKFRCYFSKHQKLAFPCPKEKERNDPNFLAHGLKTGLSYPGRSSCSDLLLCFVSEKRQLWMLKSQSLHTVLLRIPFTRTIKSHRCSISGAILYPSYGYHGNELKRRSLNRKRLFWGSINATASPVSLRTLTLLFSKS